MTPSPRRRVDWLYGILGTLIALGVGAGMSSVLDGIDDVKKDVGELRVDVGQLQIEIRLGMVDRFTGKEGVALQKQIEDLKRSAAGMDGRLNTVERFCSIVGAREDQEIIFP